MYKIKQISGYVDMSRVNQTCVVDNDEVNSIFLFDWLVVDDNYVELWSNQWLKKHPNFFRGFEVCYYWLSSSCCD